MVIDDKQWQEFDSFMKNLDPEQLKIVNEGIDRFIKAMADRGRIKGRTKHCIFEAEVELMENI